MEKVETGGEETRGWPPRKYAGHVNKNSRLVILIGSDPLRQRAPRAPLADSGASEPGKLERRRFQHHLRRSLMVHSRDAEWQYLPGFWRYSRHPFAADQAGLGRVQSGL